MEVPMTVAAPEQSECVCGQRSHVSPMTKAKHGTCGLTNELLPIKQSSSSFSFVLELSTMFSMFLMGVLELSMMLLVA